jgi:predicted SAM-dependent methyltransferase
MDELSSFADSSVVAVYASHVLEHASYNSKMTNATEQHYTSSTARRGPSDLKSTLREWHRVLKGGGALFVSVPHLRTLAKLFVNETLDANERFFVMRVMYGTSSILRVLMMPLPATTAAARHHTHKQNCVHQHTMHQHTMYRFSLSAPNPNITTTGGQTDADDFHHVGFDEEILREYLMEAGFCNLTPRRNFGLFNDGSSQDLKVGCVMYSCAEMSHRNGALTMPLLMFSCAAKGVPISLNYAARACLKPGEQIEVNISE